MAKIVEGVGPEALKSVMALSLDAVITKTRTGVITGWSRFAQDLYGYEAEEIIGRDATVLLPPGWESEEGLGQLAGGVAHDFNNLIGVILNYAAFVSEEIDTATAQGAGPQWTAASDDIGQIRRAAERAAGLTRQLLSFARREVIQPQVVDLNDLLANMASLLRRTLGADLELVTNLAEKLPAILVDPGQMDQMILNLAVNARDAMPAAA